MHQREDYVLFRLPLLRGLAYEVYFRNLDGHETGWRAEEKHVDIDAQIERASNAQRSTFNAQL